MSTLIPSGALFTRTHSPGAASASTAYALYSAVSGRCCQSTSSVTLGLSTSSIVNRFCAISRIRAYTVSWSSVISLPSSCFSFAPTFSPVFSTSGRMNGTVRTVSMYFSGRSSVLPSAFCARGYTRVTRPVTLPSHFTARRFVP